MTAGQLQHHRRFDPSKAFSTVLREPQVQAEHQQVISVKNDLNHQFAEPIEPKLICMYIYVL